MRGRGRLATVESAVTGLPVSLTELVGRRRELAELGRLIPGARLLTLVGAGGCGKTRLAIAAMERFRRRTGTDAAFVDLAALTRDEQVDEAVAQALGVHHPAGEDATDAVVRWISGREIALVLDNCEQVAGGCARFAASVLARSPGLRIVATSREPLDVAGEIIWRVPSLPVPEVGSAVSEAARADAVLLFVHRARLSDPSFQLDAEGTALVADICRALDGIPLAIELAAARVRHLSLVEIRDRLGDRLSFLIDGHRSSASRQRTLRGAVDWSYALLDNDARRLFDHLSIFRGGFSLEGAAIVAEASEAELLPVLATLVDKSLVQVVGGVTVARYALLETLRQYGLERLRSGDAFAAVAERHARHVLDLAQRARAASRTAGQLAWLERIDRERDNVGAAMDFLEVHDPAGATELTLAVAEMWGIRGRINEGRRWLSAALDRSPERGSRRYDLLWHVAWLANRQQDYDDALSAATEAAAIALTLGEPERAANAAQQIGLVARNKGDFEAARVAFEHAIEQFAVAGRDAGVAIGLRGHVRGYLNELDGARDDLARSLALLDRPELTPRSRAYTLVWSADLAIKRGDHAAATASIEDAMEVFRRADDVWVIALLLDAAAHVAMARGLPERALRLGGAAEGARDLIGGGPPPVFAMNERSWIAAARAAVGGRADTCWAEGRRSPLAQMADYALAAAAEDATRSPLSVREREVALLVSEGLTSREIAGRLFISVRTAANHVEHIRDKLGLRSRAQIARWVAEQGWSAPAS